MLFDRYIPEVLVAEDSPEHRQRSLDRVFNKVVFSYLVFTFLHIELAPHETDEP